MTHETEKSNSQVNDTPDPATEPPIGYHPSEDSANFWKGVMNPYKGGRDVSHLTPEEFVEELANQPVENKVDMEGFLKLAESGREGAISLEHLTVEEIVERLCSDK